MKLPTSIRLVALAGALGWLPPGRAQTAEEYFHRGFKKGQARDFTGALADYDRAIALEPDYTEALNGRGFVKHARGDLNGALADYDKAIASDPEYFMAYNNRGNIRRAQGDLLIGNWISWGRSREGFNREATRTIGESELCSRGERPHAVDNEPSPGQAPRYHRKGLRPDNSGRHPSSRQAARN